MKEFRKPQASEYPAYDGPMPEHTVDTPDTAEADIVSYDALVALGDEDMDRNPTDVLYVDPETTDYISRMAEDGGPAWEPMIAVRAVRKARNMGNHFIADYNPDGLTEAVYGEMPKSEFGGYSNVRPVY